MRLAEVQRRVREARYLSAPPSLSLGRAARLGLYRDTLRTLLDHDISEDARQLIEAALEAER